MLTLDEAVKFHGHKGPWLILGYKAGLRAIEVLGKDNIRCIVRLPLKTPYTCLIDGIQASSGCTLGKRLIEAYEGYEPDEIVIKFLKHDGKGLELRLRKDVVELIGRLLKDRGMEEAARVVEQWNIREAFEERLYH